MLSLYLTAQCSFSACFCWNVNDVNIYIYILVADVQGLNLLGYIHLDI
jgi:hypothetical protein